jgi:hypothetical protein
LIIQMTNPATTRRSAIAMAGPVKLDTSLVLGVLVVA